MCTWQFEDPDEMPHDAVFHLGLHGCFDINDLHRQKKLFSFGNTKPVTPRYIQGAILTNPLVTISTYMVAMSGTLRTCQ